MVKSIGQIPLPPSQGVNYPLNQVAIENARYAPPISLSSRIRMTSPGSA